MKKLLNWKNIVVGFYSLYTYSTDEDEETIVWRDSFMWNQTKVSNKLHIHYPIIQAGMAGGSTTPEMVAAVSESGGLGTLGAGYMAPEQIRGAIQRIKERTSQPFAVNLFIPEKNDWSIEEVQKYKEEAISLTKPFREALQLPKPLIETFQEPFKEQLAVVMEESVPVFSFTFGIPTPCTISKLKDKGIVTIGTATTVQEGIELEKAGIDIVVAQGSEAGGHRGTFLNADRKIFEQSYVGTMALVPQMVDHLSVPVIASGGIMDGRGVAASFTLGASGVQLGTAFLTCHESGAHSVHKEQILSSNEESTVLTRAFSGKTARGIRNTFITHMQDRSTVIPPYPIQNTVTKDIRKKSSELHNSDYMSLWAGQGTRLNKSITVEKLLKDIVEQTDHILKQ